MFTGWFFLTLVFMATNWLAVWFGWRTANFITKPAIMVALTGWFLTVAGASFPTVWFGIGLVAALAGDVFLLFEGRNFLYGMASFMLMHAAYILGFSKQLSDLNLAEGVFVTIVFALWIFFYISIRKRALNNASFVKIEIPLVIYNLFILIMVISAVLTNFNPKWPPAAGVLVSCGAVLFLFSDVLLAADRFIQPMPSARLWKRITYQIGQLAIIAGVLLSSSA